MTAMPAVAASVYRVLIYLYPPAFHREFASEMACDFEDATCEAWHDGRWLAVVPLWIHTCHDLALTVAAQWLRSGFPVLTVLSASSMTVCAFAAARLLWQPRQPIALGPNDEEAAALLVLGTMVILLATIVIMFTVCFQLLLLRRKGRVRRV